MALLNIMRWLRSRIPDEFRVLLRASGPLVQEFRNVADVYFTENGTVDTRCLQEVALIYSNTATNGLFLRSLPLGDIPVLTHIHELQCTLDWNGEMNTREILSQSAHFISCSSAVTEMLTRRYRLDPCRITTIPESIFPSEVREKSLRYSVCGSDWNGSGDAFIVVGTGTVHLRKGSDLFVQLAEYCTKRLRPGQSIHFLWIGGMSAEFSSGMFAHDVRKLGLESVVTFLGEIENPHPYIAAADLFCLPSREDPFPLVMLEAGALGKPIVAFRRSGGAEEYCSKGGGFLVPYLDVAAMGECILRCAGDKAGLISAGEKARTLVQHEYNVDATGPRILDLTHRFSRSEMEIGHAQLFLPTADGNYLEENSIRATVRANCTNHLKFRFDARTLGGEGKDLPLRFDPINTIATIQIAGMTLTSMADETVLWNAVSSADFDPILVEGDAVRIPDTRIFRLLSTGGDPILRIPRALIDSAARDCQLEVTLLADTELPAIIGCIQPMMHHMEHYRDLSLAAEQREREWRSAAEKLRLSLICAQISQQGRQILIWGSGSAGRSLAKILMDSDTPFPGFVDQHVRPEEPTIFGKPVWHKTILKNPAGPRYFVFIASIYWQEIEAELKELDYVSGADYAISPLITL
jgi:glycosyltransferase involved in cell wall biosynthesis